MQPIGILALVSLIAITLAMIVYFMANSIATVSHVAGSNGINIQDLPEQCDINYQNSPDVSELLCCKESNNNITDLKYIEMYDMVVSSVPRPYLAVCSQFCRNGVNSDQKTCTDIGDDPDIDSQQHKFNQCIGLTKPSDCIGDVKPVAYDGITRYYAYSAGKSLCQTTGTCVG